MNGNGECGPLKDDRGVGGAGLWGWDCGIVGVLCKLVAGDYKMGVFKTGYYELKHASELCKLKCTVILCKPDKDVVRRVHAAMLCELARHGKLINAS